MQQSCDQATVDYVSRYGGMCRDCADEDGICPTSGLPCAGAERQKAIRHVIEAVNYGLKHGYLQPSGSEAKENTP